MFPSLGFQAVNSAPPWRVGVGVPLVVAQDLAMKIKVFDDECLCELSRALQELSRAP